MEPHTCSEDSLSIGEPLIGSAGGPVERWILVEHHGPWGSSVPDDLPEMNSRLRERLIEAQCQRGVRVLCLRRPRHGQERPEARGRRLGSPNESDDAKKQQRIWLVDRAGDRIRVMEYEDPALLAVDDVNQWWERGDLVSWEGPLLLVCTHGTRDRCCAQHGMPLFRELEALAPERVFQSSHLGGHRFAPVVVTFPNGVVYGRVPVEAAGELLASTLDQRWWRAEYVRGNAHRDAASQVAELAVRRCYDRWEDDAVAAVVPRPAGHMEVILRSGSDPGTERSISVAIEEGCVVRTLASCGDTKPKDFIPLRALVHEVL